MKLADIFCDNMVLQRGSNTLIYGNGRGKGAVEFLNHKIEFESVNEKFMVTLPELKGGEVFDLTIALDGEKTVIKNVIAGDVYIAAGQSNMGLRLGEVGETDICENSEFRYFNEPNDASDNMVVSYKNNGWQMCKSDSAKEFSALAYYFAMKLNKETGVPIGIISCNKGASRIHSWVPKDITKKQIFAQSLKLHDETDELYKFNFNNWLYYNKLVNIVPYTVKAVLWYQGESNTGIGEADNYCGMLKELIEHWRSLWNCNLPFYIVQLMPYLTNPDFSDWAKVREEQEKASKIIPNVYMTTLFDTNESDNIHPKNKRCIGEALKNAVLNTLFGYQEMEYSGPIVNECNRNGNTAELSFTHARGMMLDCTWFMDTYLFDKNGKHYEVNGRTVEGRIEGNKLYITWNTDIEPVGVEMGYWNVPMHKLKNDSGYLASPFKLYF